MILDNWGRRLERGQFVMFGVKVGKFPNQTGLRKRNGKGI
jgi:hypothetical protein